MVVLVINLRLFYDGIKVFRVFLQKNHQRVLWQHSTSVSFYYDQRELVGCHDERHLLEIGVVASFICSIP